MSSGAGGCRPQIMGARDFVIGGVGLVLGVGLGGTAMWAKLAPTELSKEAAEALVKAEYDKRGAATCTWQEPRKETDTRWTFSPYNPTTRACAQALLNEKLINPGSCVEMGCTGGCCKQWISASGAGKLDSEGLTFPCGSFELADVTSIVTTGSEAIVKFERTYVADEGLLGRLEACKLDKPQAGKAEISRTYRRDDSGSWRAP